jgi:hypothetical protein
MKTKKAEIKIEDVTLASCKSSTFGCRNCLWASVECHQGSMFQPEIAGGLPSCKAYSYYD